jgi:hypothetical protein
MLRLAIVLTSLLAAWAFETPSCEDDISAHCLGDDADMSPEGIDACLARLGDQKSSRCVAYGALMEACAADVAREGVCGTAHGDGEGVACLLERVKPDQLTEACAAALPKDELKGIAKFWKDGKRPLTIDEISELNKDDKDTYTRWQKKKKGKKSEKDKDRDYAVRKAKRERVTELIGAAAREHAREHLLATKSADLIDCVREAKKKAEEALAEDMTGTLKPFAKSELTDICKAAIKQAKAEWKPKEEL